MRSLTILTALILTACGGDKVEGTTDTATTGTTTSTTTTTTTDTATTVTTSTTPSTCYALDFDGLNDFVMTDRWPVYDSQYTMEFWFRVEDTSGWDTVIGHAEDDRGSFSVCGGDDCDGWSGDGFALRWNPYTPIDSSIGITPGVWNHVAGVQDSGTAYLYVNGRLAGEAESYSFRQAGPLVLGDQGPDKGLSFGGQIASFRATVQVVYEDNFTPEPALSANGYSIIMLKINEGEGDMIYDSGNTSSTHEGTLYGPRWVNDCPEGEAS